MKIKVLNIKDLSTISCICQTVNFTWFLDPPVRVIAMWWCSWCSPLCLSTFMIFKLYMWYWDLTIHANNLSILGNELSKLFVSIWDSNNMRSNYNFKTEIGILPKNLRILLLKLTKFRFTSHLHINLYILYLYIRIMFES